MIELVEYMRSLGWKELDDGTIVHPEWEGPFDDWDDAIRSCVQVAST